MSEKAKWEAIMDYDFFFVLEKLDDSQMEKPKLDDISIRTSFRESNVLEIMFDFSDGRHYRFPVEMGQPIDSIATKLAWAAERLRRHESEG